MSTIEVELMKPGQLTLRADIDTVAVFKRDLFKFDTTIYKYTYGIRNRLITDTSIHYQELSNKCADNLANYLENEKYFLKVINYRDSMNYLFTQADSLINFPELHKKLNADAFIFLDYFHLWDHQTKNTNSDFIYNIQDAFPEFKKCKQFEFVSAKLIWTIFIKGDSTRYILEQPDDLYYGNTVNPEYFENDDSHRLLLENASIFLGNSLGTKILPSWKKVERIFYRSNNIHMLKAESFLLSGDWLKAAEIYNKETMNKNRNIAAKAKYNMALICEIEGKFDAATDWLVRSYSTYKQENELHQSNCRLYIELIAIRKKEIEQIEKQIRIK
jgi:hypothetical protein